MNWLKKIGEKGCDEGNRKMQGKTLSGLERKKGNGFLEPVPYR